MIEIQNSTSFSSKGIAKGEMSLFNTIVLGFLAGVFIGFGGTLSVTVAGGMGTSPDSIGILSPGLVCLKPCSFLISSKSIN